MTETPRISGTFHKADGTSVDFQIMPDGYAQWGGAKLGETVDALASMARSAREEGFFVVPERRTISAVVLVTYDDAGENFTSDDLADAIRDMVFTTVREETDIAPIVMEVAAASYDAPDEDQ